MGTINKSANLVAMFLASALAGAKRIMPFHNESIIKQSMSRVRNGFRQKKRRYVRGKTKNTNGIYTMNDYTVKQLEKTAGKTDDFTRNKGQLWLACIQNGSVNVFTAPHASRRKEILI